jgi:hypothetical protein
LIHLSDSRYSDIFWSNSFGRSSSGIAEVALACFTNFKVVMKTTPSKHRKKGRSRQEFQFNSRHVL